MSNFIAVSLGACLGIGLLLLFYRKCERWLDSGAWSWIFGFSVWELLLYVAFHVFPDLLFGHGDPSYGLIHVGFPVNPRPCLRELAAGWRPGPLEVLGWVWLIGFVLCLLGQLASLLRFWRRVDKESRPASERVQRALMDTSRALKDGVLSEKAFLRLTRIVPQAAAALAEAPASVRREQASLANQLRQALAQGDGERLAGLTRLLFEGNLGAQGDTV